MRQETVDLIHQTINQTGKTLDNILNFLQGNRPDGFLLFQDGYSEKVYINGIYEIWVSGFRKNSKMEKHSHKYSIAIITCISGEMIINEEGLDVVLKPQQSYTIKNTKEHSMTFLEDTKFVTIAIPPFHYLGDFKDATT